MGFQYGGVSSQSMKVKARLTGWQASPSVRSNTETVPGKPGLADFGADSGERYIDISCNVFPQKTFAALVSVLDRVSAWLDPTQGLKQLILDDVPDRYFQARLSDAVDCERLLRAAGSFSLRFLCPDPYGYALDDEAFVLTGAGTQEVMRQVGNTDSEPVYVLQGGGFLRLHFHKDKRRGAPHCRPAFRRGSAGDRHGAGNGESDGQRREYVKERPALPAGAEFSRPAAGPERGGDWDGRECGIFRASHTGQEQMEVRLWR